MFPRLPCVAVVLAADASMECGMLLLFIGWHFASLNTTRRRRRRWWIDSRIRSDVEEAAEKVALRKTGTKMEGKHKSLGSYYF